jgi:hypothetical protein
VLAAEGVPIKKAPSLQTEATTLPAGVENTSKFGVISVTVTADCTTSAIFPTSKKDSVIRA